MNQAEACAHKALFPKDPLQIGDINSSNWCRDCVVVHEETHMNKDWIEDSLQPEIDAFNTFLAGYGIDIDCAVSASTHCSTALTPERKAELDLIWEYHILIAVLTWGLQSHGDANEATLACYQEIRDALKAKCPD